MVATGVSISELLRDLPVEVFSELAQSNGLSSCNTGGISGESLQDMVRSSGKLLITVFWLWWPVSFAVYQLWWSLVMYSDTQELGTLRTH